MKDADDLWREIVEAVMAQEQVKLDAALDRVTTPGGLIDSGIADALFEGFLQRVAQRLCSIAERAFVDRLPAAEREAVRETVRREMFEALDREGEG